MFYSLYKNKEAALAAMEEYLSDLRVDWGFAVGPEEEFKKGWLAPCHRRSEKEVAAWAAAGESSIQWKGGTLRGVVVASEGEFSRDDTWRGVCQKEMGFAWEED